MESQGYIGNMTEQIASLYDVDLSPLQSQFVDVKDSVNDMTDALSEADDAIDMSNTTTAIDEAAQSMDNLSTAISDTNENTKAISDNMGTLSTNTGELSANAAAVSDALSSIPDAEKFNTLTTSFNNLAEAIKSVADALGVGEDTAVGGLIDALQSLSMVSIEADDAGIITQFHNLRTAVESVISAISGGGSNGNSGNEGALSSSPSMSADAGEQNSSVNGLISAVEDIKSATDEALGTGNGGDGEGTGAIGQFEQLKDAVDEVTASIGGGDSENGSSSGSEDADSLIGSIVDLGNTAEEILTGGGESEGESGGVIGRFEEFKDVIGEAEEHVTGISEGLDEIDGQEVECTIKVNIETNGSLPAFAEGTLGNMNLDSSEYTAKYGKAFAEGTGKYKGLPKPEKNALVSEYGQTEMTVLPNGNTIITDEPTMMDLPKDTVIFNEEQTKQIMNNKPHVEGNAHAGGTITTPDGKVFEPYDPDKDDSNFAKLYKAWNKYYGNIDSNVEDIQKTLSNHLVMEHNQQMHEEVNQITRNSSVVNTRNIQPSVNVGDIHVVCPGVTREEVARQLPGVLNEAVSGLHNYADQYSRIR